jgi:hypothetical protein
VVSVEDARELVSSIVSLDLDLGDCDDVECYVAIERDLHNDHASMGIAIHATRVGLE